MADKRGRSCKHQQRKVCGKFRYPLGVFPDDDFEQKQGYLIDFAKKDSEDDRFVFQVVVSQELLDHFFFKFSEMLLDPVFPILDVLSHDPFRKLDTYLATEPVSLSDYVDMIRNYSTVLFEDGFLGIGAICFHPDIEVFLTEHKIINVFTHDIAFVNDLLARWRIAPDPDLEFFFNNDHLHLPISQLTPFPGEQYDYRLVRDLFIERFSLSLQEEEEPCDLERDSCTWIIDYSSEGMGSHSAVFRQSLVLKAVSQRKAMQILTQELRREGMRLRTIYEMYRIDPAQLKPEMLTAFHRRKEGILYRWDRKRTMG